MFTSLFTRNFITIVVFCCAAAGFTACKKHAATAPASYIDSITFTGCECVGEYINFGYHVSGSGYVAIKDCSWDFGDGGQSGNANSQHLFVNPGTYTVTFNVNGTQIKRDITIVSFLNGSPYTAYMGGKRHWKGTGYGIVLEDFDHKSWSPAIDTHFAVQVINAGIVQFPVTSGGVILNLVANDTVNKYLTFAECLRTATVRYYYMADSIVYYNYWTEGHGFESLTVHTE